MVVEDAEDLNVVTGKGCGAGNPSAFREYPEGNSTRMRNDMTENTPQPVLTTLNNAEASRANERPILTPDSIERMLRDHRDYQIKKFRTTCSDCVPNL